VTTVADVLALVGPLGAAQPTGPADQAWSDPSEPASTDPAARVRRSLRTGRDRTVDDVAAVTGLDPADARSALLDLEVAGLARRGVAGWRRAATARPPR
jgi:predicted Rossmann fold nucleotide-binding protein DprA/Smf involved in DNA uptake